MKNILSVVLISILLNTGCKKTQDTLPAETQTGAYTMGFTANGTNYTTQGQADDLLKIGTVSYNMESINNTIFIDGSRIVGNNQFEIWLVLEYKDTLGTYPLQRGTFFLGGNLATESNTFNINTTHAGSVSVSSFDGRFTPFNRGTILSGTFEMEGINTDGKIIHITDGRFDIGDR